MYMTQKWNENHETEWKNFEIDVKLLKMSNKFHLNCCDCLQMILILGSQKLSEIERTQGEVSI